MSGELLFWRSLTNVSLMTISLADAILPLGLREGANVFLNNRHARERRLRFADLNI
jgi:hypothetical protein